MGKATVYGWLKIEAFRNALDGRRTELVDLAFETLKANVSKATETLVKLLESGRENISIRAADLIRVAKEFEFEGIVAKRKTSLYEPGKRSGRG